MLSEDEVVLIQDSWVAIAHERPDSGKVFYENLFAVAPEIRPLFTTDPVVQERKLVETMAAIVDLLDDPSHVAMLAGELGRRHESYGVEPGHYGVMANVLIKTLRDCGGVHATPEVLAAWEKACNVVGKAMLTG